MGTPESFALRWAWPRVIAKFIGSASSALQFVDHFRAAGDLYDYQWEERRIREGMDISSSAETRPRLFKTRTVQAEARSILLASRQHIGHRCRGCPPDQDQARGGSRWDNLAPICELRCPTRSVMLGARAGKRQTGQKNEALARSGALC